jgi:hypothetical protein
VADAANARAGREKFVEIGSEYRPRDGEEPELRPVINFNDEVRIVNDRSGRLFVEASDMTIGGQTNIYGDLRVEEGSVTAYGINANGVTAQTINAEEILLNGESISALLQTPDSLENLTVNGVLEVRGSTFVSDFTSTDDISYYNRADEAQFDIHYAGNTTFTLDSYSVGNSGGTLALQSFGGKVGIGKTNPAHELDVKGTIEAENIKIAGKELDELFVTKQQYLWTDSLSGGGLTGENRFLKLDDSVIGVLVGSSQINEDAITTSKLYLTEGSLEINGKGANDNPNVSKVNFFVGDAGEFSTELKFIVNKDDGAVLNTSGMGGNQNIILSPGVGSTDANVGIGTFNPNYKLDVAGAINATEILVNGQPISGGTGGNIFTQQLPLIGEIPTVSNVQVGTFFEDFSGVVLTGSSNEVRFRKVGSAQYGSISYGDNDGEHNIFMGTGSGLVTVASHGVGINTVNLHPEAALTVDGQVHISVAEGLGELNNTQWAAEYDTAYLLWVEKGIVTNDFALAEPSEWMDKVFEEDYDLPSLAEVEKHIKEKGYLHTMKSEKEITEKGYSLHDMNKRMVQTIEELTLHAIEQEKKIESQNDLIKQMMVRLQALEGNNK